MSAYIVLEAPACGSKGACVWNLTNSVIYINPHNKCDAGLLAHEMHHARGSLLDHWIRSICYNFSSKYRYQEELNAYVTQINTYDDPEGVESLLNLYSDFLVSNYRLPKEITMNAYDDLKAMLDVSA
jgi:hypothetical protein